MGNPGRKIRIRLLIRAGLGIGLGSGLILLVALWMGFQYKPAWYRPPAVTAELLQEARTGSAAVANDTSRQIVEARTFEVMLTDAMVNDWLAAAPQLWPDARRFVPPEISGLAVRFDDGAVRIGALYARGGLRAVVTVGLALSVTSDGERIMVAFVGAKGGALPVPRFVLESLVRHLSRAVGDRGVDRQRMGDAPGPAWEDFDSADKLFDGVALRNRFIWPNGERPIRIDAIEADEGRLLVRIEPL